MPNIASMTFHNPFFSVPHFFSPHQLQIIHILYFLSNSLCQASKWINIFHINPIRTLFIWITLFTLWCPIFIIIIKLHASDIESTLLEQIIFLTKTTFAYPSFITTLQLNDNLFLYMFTNRHKKNSSNIKTLCIVFFTT